MKSTKNIVLSAPELESGSGSNLISFVRNFFKLNDLILFLKDYIYI